MMNNDRLNVNHNRGSSVLKIRTVNPRGPWLPLKPGGPERPCKTRK